MDRVDVETPVALGAFLKLCGAATTGGHAKRMVQDGLVRVNGEVETRRGRKVTPGDVVAIGALEYQVCSSPT